MKAASFFVLSASVSVCLCLSQLSSSAQALDPYKPPGRNFNLTNFYLGLPVDSSGGTNGNSASIPAAQLTTGYSNANYFYTGPDGAMTFWAFVQGATTSGSSYPRSELREQISSGLNTSNWIPYGVHTLAAQCRVAEVPSTKKVIIGQIHCFTGNARPLVKLQYNNGVIEALIKTNSNFDPDHKFFFQNVGLNNMITYQIRMENGLITTTVNGSNRTINVFLTDPDWATNGLYFKAGSYCQDNDGDTNEGARVAFYALSRSHGPSITNHPAGALVQAGSNVTFTVQAGGNGPLRYQWIHNTTTSLASATNATLSLTNVQFSSAGAYTVRVTDTLGSNFSQVATLEVNRPPVPGASSLITGQAVPVSLPASTLLGLASDPDGDALTITNSQSTSQQGGTVALASGTFIFTPAVAFSGVDSFNYLVKDSRGGASTGAVSVTVVASNAIVLNPLTQSYSQSGVFSASFQGVAGLTYTVDRATNLAGPWQLNFTNLTAEPGGLFSLIDTNSPPAVTRRFYRVRYP